MKTPNRKKQYIALLLASSLAVSAFTGCSGKDNSNNDDNSKTNTENTTGNDAVRFKPSESGMQPQEKYEYPYAGFTAVLTDNLLAKMESYDVLMLSSDELADDGTLEYAVLHWYALTKEQKEEEVTSFDPYQWLAGLAKIGSLGVYKTGQIDNLNTLTNCTQHEELGKSADGQYTYYMSYADGADETLKEELKKTEVTLSEMLKLDPSMGTRAFSEARVDTSNVGDFQTTDIAGDLYTKDLFKDYDLTLVNVFATWCSPCIQEMPELNELKESMADKGINVVAIVSDAITPTGDIDSNALEKATYIKEKLKLSFPMLVPDETAMNGRLKGIQSVPESFFVDKDGNIVSEPYVGARSYEQWKEITEQELAKLKGAN